MQSEIKLIMSLSSFHHFTTQKLLFMKNITGCRMHRATKYGKRYLLSMHCKARSIVQKLRICLDSSKDVNQTLFSRSDVCMNKRKMTGERRLGSRAIIHPRRVRCRRERRDASKHPLMRSLLRVFSGIFLSSPFFHPLPCGKASITVGGRVHLVSIFQR